MTVRPQITFFQQNYTDEICSIVTYVANATYIVPTFPNLPAIVSTLQISEAPILYSDQQFQDFLTGKKCCTFINQDLTFLQPSTVYETTELDDSITTASHSTDISVITVKENNQSQGKDINSLHSSLTEISCDSTRTDNRPASIQPVVLVIGLTTKEQCRQ